MPLIEWTNEMSVGVKELDDHHMRLISLANALNEAILARREKDIVSDVFAEISNYTIYHFFAEEALMEKHGYPDYENHKTEHLGLTTRTLELLDALKEGRPDIGSEVLDFLKGWLQHHIFGTDKKYAPYFGERGIQHAEEVCP